MNRTHTQSYFKKKHIPITAIFSIAAVILFIASATASGAVRSNSVVLPFVQDNPHELFRKATAYQDKQSLDSALIYYSWLTETHRNSDDDATRLLVGKSLSEMGQIYYIYYNDYTSAYRCLAEAETILSETDNNRGEYAIVLLNLGNLFNLYEYTFAVPDGSGEARGRNYYSRSIEEGIASGNWNLVCSAYINSAMLDLPFRVNKPLNLRMRRLLNDSIPPSTADYRLADLLCAGTDAISDKMPSRARHIFQAMRDSIGLIADLDRFMADLCLSAVSVSENDYNGAIESISKILDAPSDRNNTDVYMEVYDLLSKYYDHIGRKDKADEYRIKFYETKDSITKQIVELEPTRIGIELEQVRDYAHRIDAEKKHTTVVAVSLLIMILLISGIAILIFRKNRQLTHKNRVIFSQRRSMLTSDTPTPPSGETKTEKYRDSSLTDETRRELIVRIESVMNNIDEICDKGFSLQRLTALVGSNTSYISRVINEHYEMTFGNLLNKYRVREACRRMEDTGKYGNLTIDTISESVGFNTRSTFTKAFRLHIGMLPSEYLKLLRANQAL